MTETIAFIAVFISLMGAIPGLYLMRVQSKKQNADASSVLVNTAMSQNDQLRKDVADLKIEVKKLHECREIIEALVKEVRALTFQLHTNGIKPISNMAEIESLIKGYDE